VYAINNLLLNKGGGVLQLRRPRSVPLEGKLYTIYRITNNSNGKLYIGQTQRTTEQRWAAHIQVANQGKDLFFYRAVRKYGAENFTLDEIATCGTKQWANFLEKMWILLLNTTNPDAGYNSTKGGEGGALVGESLEKMKIGVLKYWDDPEVRRRASESRKGRFVGESNPMYGCTDLGKPHTEETKQLLSEKAKQRFEDPEYKAMMTAASTGKNHTEQGKANIRTALLGNKYREGTTHPEEIKVKISISLKKAFAEGRRTKTGGIKKGTILGPMSEEGKQARSEGMKKHIRTPEHEAKRRAALASTHERKRLEKAEREAAEKVV
jgi:group I intron endonuclease